MSKKGLGSFQLNAKYDRMSKLGQKTYRNLTETMNPGKALKEMKRRGLGV